MKIKLIAAAALPSENEDFPPFVDGKTLHYRGAEYDLSLLDEGEEIEIGLPFVGQVIRQNGELVLSLEYKYSTETAEPNQPTDWAAYTFNVTDGQCPCPIVRKPIQPENEVSE